MFQNIQRSIWRGLFGIYRLVGAPAVAQLGAGCRFHPTCSHYAEAAIGRYGTWRGLRLTVARLSRCHPRNPGGLDPLI